MSDARSETFSTRRCGVAAFLILLSIAPTLFAQSITDARRVEFTPSADNASIDPTTGVALVNNYTVDVFPAGGAVPQQTVNLGKPPPDSDGMIRVDFVALLSVPLTPGVIYEVAVNAVGPGGTTSSARSNTFSFTLSCSPTISPTSQSATAAGGTVNVSLSAAAGCPWTAVSNAAWIAVTSGAAGTGSGTITLGVAANTGTTSRTGTVTIGGSTFTVTQAGTSCSFALSPASQTFTAAGGSSTVGVTTTAACTWTATSGAAWVTITSGGTGSGSVGITAASNSTTQSRTATLTIAGKSFVVTEQAAACSFAVSPQSVTVPAAGGTGGITVTTSSTCAWTSASGTSWISLTGSATGSGSATYTVGANSGTTTRTGTVTVAGVTVTFSQAPLTTTLTPPANLRIIK